MAPGSGCVGEDIVTGGDVNKAAGADVSSSTLLARVKARDTAAWERLVSLCSPLVYQWCRQHGLQPADAADVGQNVFEAVFRKIGDFRRERPGDSFRGWLRTIARHKVIDFLRARQGQAGTGGSDALERLALLPDEAEDSSSSGEEEGGLYCRALEVLRTEFTDQTWQAFWRVTVESQRPADVAADLGMTLNAVYLAKSRVLRRMRDEFADLLEVGPS
jgi:RNA polymerase sigma-70 factor (ECF subfamily)